MARNTKLGQLSPESLKPSEIIHDPTSKPPAFQPILALDFVRACAAIMVFLVHARSGTWYTMERCLRTNRHR